MYNHIIANTATWIYKALVQYERIIYFTTSDVLEHKWRAILKLTLLKGLILTSTLNVLKKFQV